MLLNDYLVQFCYSGLFVKFSNRQFICHFRFFAFLLELLIIQTILITSFNFDYIQVKWMVVECLPSCLIYHLLDHSDNSHYQFRRVQNSTIVFLRTYKSSGRFGIFAFLFDIPVIDHSDNSHYQFRLWWHTSQVDGCGMFAFLFDIPVTDHPDNSHYQFRRVQSWIIVFFRERTSQVVLDYFHRYGWSCLHFKYFFFCFLFA